MKRASTQLSRGLTQSATSQVFKSRPRIKIVEVSPRDGLQNEATVLDAATRAGLIASLAKAGLPFIEAGSFVSPKVKQMANTRDVLLSETLRPVLQDGKTVLSVLIPNMRGYQDFKNTMQSLQEDGVDASRIEVAVFASATEAFSKANLNASRAVALDQLAQVAQAALNNNVKVRGYVSCVVKCPYEGIVEPREVASTAKSLSEMGCYEISLGDTIGAGNIYTLEDMLSAVVGRMPLSQLAAHCHDTNGKACENVLHLVKLGVQTVDSSLAGLGGCPYAPGAKGNVATEDVVRVLEENFYDTGLVQELPGQTHEAALWQKLQDLSRLGQEIKGKLKSEADV
ncbi:aldolase [Cystobasidium minutum MCA 4210]|uniref:aldolase n=1 Tax=Cystobasidium minutum MCA 4210 TaxID=1397322 RepID=UPI0034CD243D|eukprot:jgi/Rhomi1/100500/CE100499_2134